MPEKDLESYLDELKKISEKISEEEIKLADAVALYKKGMVTAEKALKILDKFEHELEIVHEESEE